jgi:uncharacterized protein YceK
MKNLSIILAVVLLSSCSSMHTSGGGSYGSTSSQGISSTQPFDPNNPYHGG